MGLVPRSLNMKFLRKKVLLGLNFCCAHTVVGSGQHHKIKIPHVKVADTVQERWDVRKTRNLGVMAHIDAGKTTTTERLLYFAGVTKTMGDVDSGDTVTDYMAQERERGITITSAAITFYWNHHRINLIDTPGHVDFTLEVERCLRVLDGAVTVLDASAGVEAQTLTVWAQAQKFGIPSIVFLNKMDKIGASVELCLRSIEKRLKIQPLLISTPIYNDSLDTNLSRKEFSGIIDLLKMETLEWPSGREIDGRTYKKTPISEKSQYFQQATVARENLMEILVEQDDVFAEKFLLKDSAVTLNLDADILPAIRRLTLARKIVPVLCGSALKKKAVQPLLNMVCDFLPSPNERAHVFLPYYKNHLCALAFKITYDKILGPLTFLRIYSGSVRVGSHFFNATRGVTENVPRLYIPHSDQLQETREISENNIAVVAGLKQTITGDTIVETEKIAKEAFDAYHQVSLDASKNDDTAVLTEIINGSDRLLLAGIEPPDPVYFCTIEPPSLGAQNKMDDAMKQLVREDPSLKVKFDDQSQQTIMEGMGELHIEVIKDRLKREFGLDVFLGPLQINYRECVKDYGEKFQSMDETINEKKNHIGITLSVQPDKGAGKLKELQFLHTKGESSLANLRRDWLSAIKDGCMSACLHGPLLGYPVQDITVTLHNVEATRGVSAPLISACANRCLIEAMKTAGTKLLEPIMSLEISIFGANSNSDTSLHNVLGDLTRRRAEIRDVGASEQETGEKAGFTEETRTVRALAPLAELTGLVKSVRTMTSGRGNLHMELEGYREVTQEQQKKVINQVTGLV